MFLKKFAAPLLAGLLTVFLLAAPASAHGGHHGRGYGCAAPQISATCPIYGLLCICRSIICQCRMKL